MSDFAAGNGTRPVPPIRAERKGRGWTVATMARKLRDAADDPQKDVPDLDSLRHNIFRWERGGYGVSERYRNLYCRVFGRTEWELFGIEPPDISEKRQLGERMRAAGLDYRQIATEFSRVYKLRPRAAWRESYGWSLQETVDNINAFRGDTGLDPGGLSGMTSSRLCEYENWPGYGGVPTGRKPSPYLLTVLASIYDCQVSDLIDLADRQHLPKADILILDTYTRHPSPAPNPADGKPELLLRSQAAVDGVVTSEDASGNCYVVLVLPPGPQRIAIDVTGADADEQSAASQPVRWLTLVGE